MTTKGRPARAPLISRRSQYVKELSVPWAWRIGSRGDAEPARHPDEIG